MNSFSFNFFSTDDAVLHSQWKTQLDRLLFLLLYLTVFQKNIEFTQNNTTHTHTQNHTTTTTTINNDDDDDDDEK